MYRQACSARLAGARTTSTGSLRLPSHARHFSQQSRPHSSLLSRPGFLLASTGVVAATLSWLSTHDVVYNDSESPGSSKVVGYKTTEPAETRKVNSDTLDTLVWGSNRSHLLTPDAPDVNSIRIPAVASWLENVALRDLALHKHHAACVDAHGDVYQWGDGFFGDAAPEDSTKPTLTLRGKNIIKLQPTESRLFALSASGNVYVLAAKSSKQVLPLGAPTPSSTPWWSTGWMWGEEDVGVDFAEITPREPLSWGERFVDIRAGENHVLALTSSGRTFAHPVNKNANAFGQLGIRKLDIPDPASLMGKVIKRLAVELTPRSATDPYARASRVNRAADSLPSQSDLSSVDDQHIRFCDHLFEIPSLKGIDVAQIAAGSRSSFVRTREGRVLAWGANEYGQLGLGSNVTLDTITVPTEVILWRAITPGRKHTRCLSVAAGGDLTSFVAERMDEASMITADLLMCGNGQYGGLGNNLYSNGQGNPIRARTVSSLTEYSDEKQGLQCILPHSVSVSPTGHVLLSLDTARAGAAGRDLVVWGANQESQLGNGKKSSLAVPTMLDMPDGERFLLGSRKAAEVRDLRGKVWKRGVRVEQAAVAGYGTSVVYWKIV